MKNSKFSTTNIDNGFLQRDALFGLLENPFLVPRFYNRMASAEAKVPFIFEAKLRVSMDATITRSTDTDNEKLGFLVFGCFEDIATFVKRQDPLQITGTIPFVAITNSFPHKAEVLDELDPVFLGFDVVDSWGGYSGLGYKYSEEEIKKINELVENKVSILGLFDELESAEQFCLFMDKQNWEHAPHIVWEIHTFDLVQAMNRVHNLGLERKTPW